LDDLDAIGEAQSIQSRLDGGLELVTRYRGRRAGYTLAVLDRLFPDKGVTRAQLAHEQAERGPLVAPLGKLWVERLFDPPGHVRLPVGRRRDYRPGPER
jgi:hypothetical protein